MDQIQITLAEVVQTAAQLRSCNDQLNERLLTMRKMMNELEQGWQSPAAAAIREKFNGMLPIFTNYYEIISTYAKFLDMTAEAYEQIENSIFQQASSFL